MVFETFETVGHFIGIVSSAFLKKSYKINGDPINCGTFPITFNKPSTKV